MVKDHHSSLGVGIGLQRGSVADYMRTRIDTLEADMEFVQAAERFLASYFRRFPVMRDGRLVGQISRTDVLRGLMENWR